MSLAQHIAFLDQLGEDLVGPALGDSDGSGDVAQANARIMGDAEQDVRVVCEEVPAANPCSRRRSPHFSRIVIHEMMLHCFRPPCDDWRHEMTILNSQRFKRFILGREVDVAGEVDAVEPSQSDDSPLPIPGYDRIKDKDLITELSKHSQAELAAIETYERSHKKRLAVFDKLRYLRGQEPLQGYDALGVKEILVGLEGADVGTLQRTRVYERKFQRRPDLLEEVATSIRGHRPASVNRAASVNRG
jgi:hypothetical protein